MTAQGEALGYGSQLISQPCKGALRFGVYLARPFRASQFAADQ
jgi:hypothetical protein